MDNAHDDEPRYVAILSDRDGNVCSVWDDPKIAVAKIKEFNANPYARSGAFDRAAPYSVHVWRVQR